MQLACILGMRCSGSTHETPGFLEDGFSSDGRCEVFLPFSNSNTDA